MNKSDLIEVVTALKNEPGNGTIGMSGSVSVVRQLLAAGLLDEHCAWQTKGVLNELFGINAPEKGWNDYAGIDIFRLDDRGRRARGIGRPVARSASANMMRSRCARTHSAHAWMSPACSGSVLMLGMRRTLWVVPRDQITAIEEFPDEFDLKYRRVDGYSIKARLKEARERAGTAASRAG